MPKYKKIINSPSLGMKYKELPEQVQKILTDRGKEFTYAMSSDVNNDLYISCILPTGVVVTGIAYKHPNDEKNFKLAMNVAAGKLEGTLIALIKKTLYTYDVIHGLGAF